MSASVGQRPSVSGIFIWANERFRARWPGLFAIALVSAIIPVARMAIAREHSPKASPIGGLVIAMIQELLLLLCTAAMVLLVIRPDDERATGAVRDALRDAPRLVLVKIATAVVRFVPALALAAIFIGIRGGLLMIVFGFLLLPLTFLCQLAFVGAVVERTGPITAIQDTFRRAKLSGFGIVVGLAILISLIEQIPPVVFAYIANAIFPPAPVPIEWPHVPGQTVPQMPTFPPQFPFPGGLTTPGRFGSAIPWGAHVVMLLADMPFFAYMTVVYTGAALAFADTEPAAFAPEEPAPEV